MPSPLPPVLTVLPFAAPWKAGPYPEDAPLVVVDGPDYSLRYLLRRARRRARPPATAPADRRCAAVIPDRSPSGNVLATKHRCRRFAGPAGYCEKHAHFATPQEA